MATTMQTVAAWVKLAPRKYSDGQDRAAMVAITKVPKTASAADLKVAGKALALMLKRHPHVLWEAAKRLAPHLRAPFDALVADAASLPAAFYRSVPAGERDAGLAVLSLVHHYQTTRENVVAKLRKLPAANGAAIKKAARAFATGPELARAFAAVPGDDIPDECETGLAALALMHGDDAAGLLAHGIGAQVGYLTDLAATATPASKAALANLAKARAASGIGGGAAAFAR